VGPCLAGLPAAGMAGRSHTTPESFRGTGPRYTVVRLSSHQLLFSPVEAIP